MSLKCLSLVVHQPISRTMKSLLLGLLLVSSYPVFGVFEDDDSSSLISEEYEEGRFLIYNCENKHWACVSRSDYNDCEKRREKDHENLESPFHSCAIFTEFPRKKSCSQRILFLTTHNHGTRFCLKDSWKLKTEEL